MKLETNICRIEELTLQNDDDDRRYRFSLEGCDLSSEEIDAMALRHFREVSGQIECRECGNCCRVFRPPLSAEDIGRLARRTEMPREAFITEYLVASDNGGGHCFRNTPCPFLVDNACTVYDDRPEACRLYPSFCKKGFVSRLDLAFSSCSVCPIVFNVYERVKAEIRQRGKL
jgi:Fe-S-cluster containining protein